MALPAPIQAQIDAANETLQQLNAPPRAPADLQALAQQQPDPPQDPEPPKPPPTEDPPAASPPPQPPAPSNDATWEQRFKTLQGLFNAKVPTLQKQVEALQSELQTAVTRLNAAAEETRPPKPDPLKSSEHTADVEAFGADLVDMVQRVIDRKVAPAVSEAQSQLQNLAKRVTQVEEHLRGTSQAVVASAEDRFFDRLVSLVPDWEEINAEQAFLDWLAQIDPVYGQPRQAALAAAQQALDAGRAAAVFKAFVATRPPASPKNAPAVDRQVSPRASAATPPPQPANKPLLTEKQIAEFYDAKRRGHYRGKESEAAAIEQVINQAIAEGRVA